MVSWSHTNVYLDATETIQSYYLTITFLGRVLQGHLIPVGKNDINLEIQPISGLTIVNPVSKNVTIFWIKLYIGLQLILLSLYD